MAASPALEAKVMPAMLGDGDNAAACFGPVNNMQVEKHPPNGTSNSRMSPPAALSPENCGPPGPGARHVNGC